jgi:hypothetical protein
MALKDVWRRTTPLDRLLVLVLFAGALGALVWGGVGRRGATVVALSDGKVVFSAPLDVDRSVALSGPLGKTILVIKGGRARITESPCPRKLCIAMGAISRSGQIIACVPNRILVKVTGSEPAARDKGYDLLSR